jgi:hypothetical protein
VFASSDLLCFGKEYSLYMGVGVDEKGNGDVGFASITDKNAKKTIEYYSSHIKTINLKWVDSEEDFSRNSLNVELSDKNGKAIKVTAKGSNGELHYKSNIYKIVCDWEM